MKRTTDKLISLLGTVFSQAARMRMLDGKTFLSGERAVSAAPGLFYRGGAPVRPGFILTFMRAIRPNGRVPVFFVRDAQTDARTEAVTDVTMFLLQ